MRYKVGDKVRIKSIDWYNENKDNYGSIYAGNGFCFWKNMARLCGEIMKITSVKVDPEDSNKGYYFMENSEEKWTDEMIEGLVEEEVGLVDNLSSRWVNEFNLPDGYIFKDENGNVINAQKIVLEKKKKEYPKTYEECLSVLGIYNGLPDVEIYNAKPSECKLFESLIRLKRCRDAYWKIAGEEMGLDKPWENSRCEVVYGICRDEGNIVKRDDYWGDTHIFEFPIREMRDAFKQNFDPDIEICKEFL